ncbi:hypothetical protein Lal_00005148 [Lupinus albus]|nr:hypothetical protein Lal_00005148 [Lupinus albus]
MRFHLAVWIPAIAIAFAISTTFLWLFLINNVRDFQNLDRQIAEDNALMMAKAYQEYMLRSIQQIDQAAQFIVSEYEKNHDQLSSIITHTSSIINTDYLFQVSILDKDGFLKFSNLRNVNDKIDLSDREHFRVHLTNSQDFLFISKPVLGRVSKKWSIQFTRKMFNDRGDFDGVIVLSVEPSRFALFSDSVSFQERDAIALLRVDGTILSRVVGGKYQEQYLGAVMQSLPFMNALALDSGVYDSDSPIDGIQRIVGYQKLRDYGLVALALFDEEAAFARSNQARSTAYRIGGVGTFLLALASLASGLAIRAILHEYVIEQTMNAELRATHQELELAHASLKRREEELVFLSETDALCRVANRRRFMAVAESELTRHRRYGRTFSILVLDVDHFKAINDTYGHSVGDVVLVTLSDRIRARLRATDTFARIGGEEFAVFLPETDTESALSLAEELRSTVSADRIDAGNGQSVDVTISIGISSSRSGPATVSDLLNSADHALYAAKREGRNRSRSRSASARDQFPDPCGQHIHGEGLGQHRHAGFELTVVQQRVLSESGDEQGPQCRTADAGEIDHLAAVHAAGQADVGHHQIDARVGLQHPQPGGAVCRLDRGIAEVAQQIHHHQAQARLVVHHQNGLALPCRQGRDRLLAALLFLRLAAVAGQIQAHHGALANLRINLHMAAGLLGEAVDHRQPQSGALADGLGGEEGIEGLFDHVRRHAGAVVRHAERHILAGMHVLLPRPFMVDPAVAGLDGDPAAARHGVAGVDAEVQQRVFQLRWVDHRRPQPGHADHLHLDARSHGALDQLQHAADQPVGVDRLRRQRLLAGEGEQPVGQRRRPPHRPLRGDDELVQLVDAALVDAGGDAFQRARDAGQQVVEVVRQPAGQLSDRFHLLRLAQLLFGPHQLRGARGDALFQRFVQRPQRRRRPVALGFHSAAFLDIHQHAGEAQRLAVRPKLDPAVGLDPVVVSVRPLHPVLMGIGAAAGDGVLDRSDQCRLVVGMDAGGHLLQAQPVASQRRIEAEGVGEGLVDREAIGGHLPNPGADDGAGRQGQLDALHVLPRQRLADAQGLLRAAPRSDIAEQDGDLAQAGRLQPCRRHLDVTLHQREMALEPDRLAGAQDIAVQLDPAIRLGGSQVAHRHADDVADAGLAFVPVIGLNMDIVDERTVGGFDEFDDAKAIVDGIEQGAIAVLAPVRQFGRQPLFSHTESPSPGRIHALRRPPLCRADAGQETFDLGLHLFGLPRQFARGTQHLGRGAAGLGCALADLGDVPRHHFGAACRLLDIAGDLAGRRPLLLDGRRDGGGDLVDCGDGAADPGDGGGGFAGRLLHRLNLAGDLLRRLGGLVGEVLHLRRHHGESLAGFAGARRLDGGVQRQQVGLAGDVGDQLHHVADALGSLDQPLDLPVGRIRFPDRLGGDGGGPRDLRADFRDRCRQFVGRRRHGLHVDRRLLRRRRRACGLAVGLLRGVRHALRGGVQFGGGGADGAQDARHAAVEAGDQPFHRGGAPLLGQTLLLLGRRHAGTVQRVLTEDLHRAGHAADLVAAVLAGHLDRQVAVGEAGHRPGDAGDRLDDAGARDGDAGRGGQTDAADADHQHQRDRPGAEGVEFVVRLLDAVHVPLCRRLQGLAQRGAAGAAFRRVSMLLRRLRRDLDAEPGDFVADGDELVGTGRHFLEVGPAVGRQQAFPVLHPLADRRRRFSDALAEQLRVVLRLGGIESAAVHHRLVDQAADLFGKQRPLRADLDGVDPVAEGLDRDEADHADHGRDHRHQDHDGGDLAADAEAVVVLAAAPTLAGAAAFAMRLWSWLTGWRLNELRGEPNRLGFSDCHLLSRTASLRRQRLRGGDRGAEGFQQLGLLCLGDRHVARLDRAVAAHLHRQLGDLHRQIELLAGQAVQQLAHHRLIVGDQLAFLAALGGAAERVEPGAAQALALGEQAQDRQHPRAEALLLRFAAIRFGLAHHRRGHVEGQLPVALEHALDILDEAAVGVEAGHLILVLVGHQLEVGAGDRLGQRGGAGNLLLLGPAGPVDQRVEAGGIGGVLVIDKEAVAALDRLVQAGGRTALVEQQRRHRLHHLLRLRGGLHRCQIDGGATAPLEGVEVQLHRHAVQLDGLEDRLLAQRDQALLPGIAHQERVGVEAVAQERGGEFRRVEGVDIRLAAAGLADVADQIAHRDHHVRLLDEVGGDAVMGVDDGAGAAGGHLRQAVARRRDDQVAAQHRVGPAGGDADGVDVLRRVGDADVAGDRAALLRQPGHVEHADALALDVGGHAEQRADGDDAGAADAGDIQAPGLVEGRDDGGGQGGPIGRLRGGRLRLAQLPTFHCHEAGAEALVAAALADQLVDDDALGRIDHLAALAAAALLGGAGLVIDQDADARDLAHLLLHAVEIVAMLDGGELRQPVADAVFLRLVADDGDALHALRPQDMGDGLHGQRAVEGLATGHGDRVVEQDLVGDVHLGGDGLTDRQHAGMEIGAVAQVGEDVLFLGEGGLTDPRHALAAHLGEGVGRAVEPRRHVMAADAAQRPAAVRHDGGGVVRAAGAEGRLAHDTGHMGLLLLLRVEEGDAAGEVLVVDEALQAAADHHGDLRRGQLAGTWQDPFALLVELADHLGADVGVPVVQLFLQLVLDDRALLLDHDDLFQTLGEVADAVTLQRPGHADLVDGDAPVGGHLLGDAKLVEGLPDVEIALAGGDDAEARARALHHHPVQLVGPRERQGGVQLVLHQPVFLLQRRVGPADVQAARRQLEIGWDDRRHPVRVDMDRRRRVHRLGDGLHRDPAAGIAAHLPADQAVIQDLLHPRRVQHRDHGMHVGVFGLVREGGGFAVVVVAGQHQHAAVAGGAGGVGMLEHVARPVDAGALAVPHGEDAVILGAFEHADLLAAPDRRCAQLLVHAGLELDVVLFKELAGIPQILVEPAQRRAAIAGNEAAGVQPGGEIALALHHRQADQRLGAAWQTPGRSAGEPICSLGKKVMKAVVYRNGCGGPSCKKQGTARQPPVFRNGAYGMPCLAEIPSPSLSRPDLSPDDMGADSAPRQGGLAWRGRAAALRPGAEVVLASGRQCADAGPQGADQAQRHRHRLGAAVRSRQPAQGSGMGLERIDIAFDVRLHPGDAGGQRGDDGRRGGIAGGGDLHVRQGMAQTAADRVGPLDGRLQLVEGEQQPHPLGILAAHGGGTAVRRHGGSGKRGRRHRGWRRDGRRCGRGQLRSTTHRRARRRRPGGRQAGVCGAALGAPLGAALIGRAHGVAPRLGGSGPGGAVAAVQHRIDAAGQGGGRHRLGQHGIGAGIPGAAHGGEVGVGGQHDDRHAGPQAARRLADPLDQLRAAHRLHHPVGHHQVEDLAAQRVLGLLPVADRGDLADAPQPQHVLQRPLQQRIVVDNQDLDGGGGTLRHGVIPMMRLCLSRYPPRRPAFHGGGRVSAQ